MKIKSDDGSNFLKLKIAELEMRLENLEHQIKQNQTNTEKRFYSIGEFASLMHLTPQTIYNKIHSGEISAVKIGKCWRIPYKNL